MSLEHKEGASLQGGQWRQKREKALERDNWQCKFCAITDEEHTNQGEDDRGLDVHHIVPRQDGGTHEVWNLISVCRSCHALLEECTRKAVDTTQQSIHEVPLPEDALSAEEIGWAYSELTGRAQSNKDRAERILDHSPILKDRVGELYLRGTGFPKLGNEDFDIERELAGEALFWFYIGVMEGHGAGGEVINHARFHLE